METSQRNFLCGYGYLKLAKMSCCSFYLFSSTKSENRRVEQVLWGGRRDEGVGTGGRQEVARKMGRMNMANNVYTCM
jgi:hypothetical protein